MRLSSLSLCALSSFAVILAHPRYARAQLRNPLHAMQGAIQQLVSGELDPAAAREEVASLAHGLRVMVDITNDLLDVEALRAGRLRVRPVPPTPSSDAQWQASALIARRRGFGVLDIADISGLDDGMRHAYW